MITLKSIVLLAILYVWFAFQTYSIVERSTRINGSMCCMITVLVNSLVYPIVLLLFMGQIRAFRRLTYHKVEIRRKEKMHEIVRALSFVGGEPSNDVVGMKEEKRAYAVALSIYKTKRKLPLIIINND